MPKLFLPKKIPMDRLRLAQLRNKHASADKKIEILNKLDINYCVSSEPTSVPDYESYLGYNCVHIAVIRCDFNLIQHLLSLGADFLKQGARDGKTPLHKAVDIKKYSKYNSLWDIMGELQKDQFIETLLFAQVKGSNKLNPKSMDGVSHLHIACIFNHVEAVEFFTRAGEPLNQATDKKNYKLAGYTPLHFAVRYSSVEAAEILLMNGADIHYENAKGESPLHLMVKHLLDYTEFITKGQRALSSPYERGVESMNSIISCVLKTRKDNPFFIDDIGLSAFHIACTLKDNSFVKHYLESNVDINLQVTEIWPGWTPLHFAACFNVETVKLLLQRGADFRIKNAEGFTALDMCLQIYNPEIVHSILSSNPLLENILLSDASIKLSNLLLAMKDCDRFENFLTSLADVNVHVPLDSPLWQGYSILHLAVSMNEKTKMWMHFAARTDSQNKLQRQPQQYNCTEDEQALYWKRIEKCLEKDVNVISKNCDGLTPVHLAFKWHKTTLVRKLLLHCKENVADSNNLSLLHMACAMGKHELVKQFLLQGADANSRVAVDFEWHELIYSCNDEAAPKKFKIQANSTPLHIAAAFGYATVAKHLIERGADIYAENSFGLTPVHLTMVLCRTASEVVEVLFDTPNVRDVVHESGLSHLHAAVFNQVESAVEKLLQAGADANGVVKPDILGPGSLRIAAGRTPLLLFGHDFDTNIFRLLIKYGADVAAESPSNKYETPLLDVFFEFKFETPYVEALKQSKETGSLDSNGMTRLHVACATFDVEWAIELLLAGADPNARVITDKDMENGFTPLHMLTSYADFAVTEDEGFMPRQQVLDLVQIMLQYGADILCPDFRGNTPLLIVYRAFCSTGTDDESLLDKRTFALIADLMLNSQQSCSINPENEHGFSHLHVACARNKVKLVERFLDNGFDVNYSTYPFGNQKTSGFTPLHVALQHGSAKVARLLIKRGADVRAEDCNGNTPLHTLLQNKMLSKQLIELLLSQGADINARNFDNESPVDLLMHRNKFSHELLQLFLDRGSLIDVRKNISTGEGAIGLAMKNARSLDKEMVLETLIKHCDLETVVKNGFTAVQNVVSVRKASISHEVYLKIIERLMEIGSELDEIDSQGNTPLHAAISFDNARAVKALLLLGADLNLIENRNKPSFMVKIMTTSQFNENIRTTLLHHLWKMKLTNLDLVDSIQAVFQHVEWTRHISMIERSASELNKANKTKIIQSLVVGSFLSEWGAVNEYPTMPVFHREAIGAFFKQRDAFSQEFPEFAGLLMMQYRKALTRMKLMQPVKNILISCGVALPDLCLEAILKYLKNSELKFIVDELDEIIQPRKRQKIE